MIVLSGGLTGATADTNDTWALSTSGSPQWTLLAPANGIVPPQRVGQSAVYDSANSRIIMFGGGLGGTAPCDNNVWVLSNANSVNGTPTWTQLVTTGGPPVPRVFHSAVYDPLSNRMIVFGGNNCSESGGTYYNDVWVLSNANGLGGTPAWTQLSPAGGPSVRQGAATVYDPNSNRMTVFGGFAGQEVAYSDVWVLSSANGLGGTPTWTQLNPMGALQPDPRDFASAVYDRASNRMTIFGGIDVGLLLNDVWTLSSANGLAGTPTWTLLGPSPAPLARSGQTAVYDATGDRMIMFGGIDSSGYANDTWVLTNANGLAPGPQAVSVSPSTGSGSSQLFTFVYGDVNGAAQLGSAQAIVNASVTGVSSCYVWVTPANGAVWLANNDASWGSSMTLATGGTLQNSQCAVNVGLSSGVLSGNTYTLNLSISFLSGFSGAKNLYGLATDMAAANSGWETLGTWTVTASSQAPHAVSVSPSSGSGATQQFTFVYTDPNGASDLASAQAIFGASATGVSSCYVWVTPASGAVWLANDAGGWGSSMTLGTGGTLQNSQCSLNVGSSGGVSASNNYTLTLLITFQNAFSGSKSIFGLAGSMAGLNSGWQTLGSWTTGAALHAVSVSPSTGNGASQTFTFVYTDANGAMDLASAQALINTSITGVSACYVWVTPGNGAVWLANDDGSWGSSMTLGTGGTLQNSQCSVTMASSGGVLSGTTYTLHLLITFQSAFNGAKNVYGLVTNMAGLNSGWQALGTWTATGNNPPTLRAVSVNPSTGNALTQTFTFVYTDSSGTSDFSSAQALINGSFTAVSGCYVWVTPASGAVWLANNDGSWPAGGTLGTGVAMQNSQCSVNVAASNGAVSGNTYTLNLVITFQGGFTGLKSIFGLATSAVSGVNSGWTTLGTWTP